MSCDGCHRKFGVLPQGLRVRESRDIAPDELLVLMQACGDAACACIDAERMEQAIENSPYVAQARDAGGNLVGYLSAFSDSARAVFIADFMVHPLWRRLGIGRRLMQQLEAHYAGVPVQLEADSAALPFFEKLGYHTRPLVQPMVKTAAPARSLPQ